MKNLFQNLHLKKSKGSIILTLSIFILAIIVFSICAIDAGYVVTSRYKTQKITETLALYMVSTLNSLPPDKRSKESLKYIKERFEKLYSSKEISGYHSFKIADIQIKNIDSNPKIKVSTETLLPPLFLRYAKIGMIKICQTAYASSEEKNLEYISSQSTKNYYTFKAKTYLTDKTGNDIKVEYDGGYFIFAGLMDSNGEIRWVETGSTASGQKTKYTLIDKVTNDEITAWCLENTNTFDLNSDPNKTIGLVKYLRIYRTNCLAEELPSPSGVEEDDKTAAAAPDEETEEPATESIPDKEPDEENLPVVTILNSVKLIKKSKF